ncbi:MAG: hypothetical protein ACUZ8N_04970 [Candidatus Scalindua sp.]
MPDLEAAVKKRNFVGRMARVFNLDFVQYWNAQATSRIDIQRIKHEGQRKLIIGFRRRDFEF